MSMKTNIGYWESINFGLCSSALTQYKEYYLVYPFCRKSWFLFSNFFNLIHFDIVVDVILA
jgi:hypothetical protein